MSEAGIPRVFVSISGRFIAAVEHANMTGQVATTNITKHRTIYKPVRRGDKYVLVNLPAISGQSILNAYERALVDLVKNHSTLSSKLDDNCKGYDFIKHANDNECDDNELIKSCVIEDVTGYLVPKGGCKRTSTIQFSYMVPDTTIAGAVVTPQMFSRYSKVEQMIGTREAGHAYYRLSVFMDVSRIGLNEEGKPVVDEEERRARVEVAFKALMQMFSGGYIGANNTRALFIDYNTPTSLVAVVSKTLPFKVSPAEGPGYICTTAKRLNVVKEWLSGEGFDAVLYYMDREGGLAVGRQDNGSSTQQPCNLEGEEVSDLNDLIRKVADKAIEWLFGGSSGGGR